MIKLSRRCRMNSQPEGDCRPAVPLTTSAEQRISRGGGLPARGLCVLIMPPVR